MRTCPKCKKELVTDDGYCAGWCREMVMMPLSVKRGTDSQQRRVSQRTCMVIADRELCENKAEWRVRSHKHHFDMFVCPIHGKAFLGMKGVDVEPMANGGN